MFKCKICGKEFEKSPYSHMDLCGNDECFSTDFWNEKLEIKDDPRTVRVNGTHYWIGDETKEGFRGFDGATFVILFNNGRFVKTTNLWCQGDIPLHFRAILEDNAVFIKEMHVEEQNKDSLLVFHDGEFKKWIDVIQHA